MILRVRVTTQDLEQARWAEGFGSKIKAQASFYSMGNSSLPIPLRLLPHAVDSQAPHPKAVPGLLQTDSERNGLAEK